MADEQPEGETSLGPVPRHWSELPVQRPKGEDPGAMVAGSPRVFVVGFDTELRTVTTPIFTATTDIAWTSRSWVTSPRRH